MKKILLSLLTVIVLCTQCAGALAADNLIENGSFSEMDGELPAHWRREMWLTDAGISLLGLSDDGWEGAGVCVTNVDANDARFAQTVAVEPDTLYRISGMIRAEGCDGDGYGATLSVGGVFVYSESKYDTHGQWDYVELYGRTGDDQDSLDVFCRVGGYGTLSRGKAWFDSIEMTPVEEAPEGVVIQDFFSADTGSAAPVSAKPEAPERYTQAWLLFTAIYVLLAVGVIRKRGRIPIREEDSKGHGAIVWIIVGLAMLVRLIVAARVPGYHTDINCFSSWSERIFTTGLTHFYAPDYFCDYPPGYMLLLWPVAMLRRAMGLELGTAAYRVVLKLLPMLADVAGALLVWRQARKHTSARLALLLTSLYAFNPAAIVNSAAWGQIDGLLALLVALCAVSAVEDHYFRALLWFTAALMVKPQALLFAPLGLVALLTGILRRKDSERRIRELAAGTVACLGILYLSALLFSWNQAEGNRLLYPVLWIRNQYFGAMQGYRYMTINTLNLHYLLGLNWAQMDAHPAAQAAAWLLFAGSYAYTAVLCWLNPNKPHRLLLLGGALIVLITAFGPMMHERYVFPAMLLLMLAFTRERDVRLLASLIALTATLFLNEVLVLQGGMTAANYGHLQTGEQWLNLPLSLVSVVNALFLGWTSFDLCVRNHTLPLKAVHASDVQPALFEKVDWRLRLRRADYLLMAGVTLAYSVLAFTNLGTTRAPQNGWTSSRMGERVTFDLGQERTFRMTYYGGICNSTFTVSLSNDGENWTDELYAKYNQGEIFRWIWFTPLDENANPIYEGQLQQSSDMPVRWTLATSSEKAPMQTARYIRIEAQSAGLNLLEFGFLDENGKPWLVAGVEQSGQTPESESRAEALIDEQDTVAAYPSYLNSTYFDEIYHARTSYEHLHGMNTYEYTHPPLGKVTMMLGIRLFGMTPFGWRFMGTLAGVLMLPVMYLMVMQLTADRRLSLIAMSLLALDSMHFTQTRIATIDSYAVFWIMVMYLFMFRYCKMSWNHVSLRRTLMPLGLCGIAMGMACATKWIGIYAAAGLAILFFWTLFKRIEEGRSLGEGSQILRNTAITLTFCVVFFIVIPLLIYYFSYYWHLRAEGLSSFSGMFSGRWVRRVIQIQKSMFSYHAGLGGDTHYFRSPWYQWPVIWWPMWYYSGTDYMPEGTISSISCMGNPAVWWFGLAAIIYLIVRVCCDRKASRIHLIVVISFASQFLPWVLVPRSTFIYHYFASVPFIIIASVLMLAEVRKKSPQVYTVCACTLLVTAAALFAMFYPLESGLPCPRDYARHLRWFKWYNY